MQGNAFYRALSKVPATSGAQLNIEGTIGGVKRLSHKTKALVIFLQETHCTCVDKKVILKFALAGSIPSRKHGLATFVRESLSWTQASRSPKDSEIEWLCMDDTELKINNVYNLHPCAF